MDDQADKHDKDFAPQSKRKSTCIVLWVGKTLLIGRPSEDLLTGFGWSRTIRLRPSRLRRIDQANRQEPPHVRDNQRLAQLFSITILHLYGNQCSTTHNRALNPKGDRKAINLVPTNTPSTDCSFASFWVSFHKQANKWIAQIMIEGKIHHIGSYESEKEAALLIILMQHSNNKTQGDLLRAKLKQESSSRV